MRRLLASGSKVQGGEGVAEMEGEDGEDGASAGRVEGGADAPAAHAARPSEHTARSSCSRMPTPCAVVSGLDHDLTI